MKSHIFALTTIMFATSAGAVDIGIKATADNEYGIFLGDRNSAKEMIAWVENYSRGGAGIWDDAESYTKSNLPSGSQLYVVASSDYAVLQGLLAPKQASSLRLAQGEAAGFTGTCRPYPSRLAG
jgi:hypothetical protein